MALFGRCLSTIRNIGIIAHIDAGKTTTTEKILQAAGYIKHAGSVDRGDTVMDYLPQERERGITINAATITFRWGGCQFNLVDTPGHVDFGIEVERAMRVMDGAVAVLDASAGVEAQTMAVWKQAERHAVPRLIFVNKLDKVGACMASTVKEVERKLSTRPLLCQWPVSGEHGVHIEDLVAQKDSRLLDSLCELDDQLLLMDVASEQDIRDAIRRVTLSGKGSPVFCGSAMKSLGIEALLQGILDYLPPPPESGTDLVAVAFKVVFDENRGLLVYTRVYSGAISAKQPVWNINKGVQERVQKIYRVQANDYHEVETLGPGDIGILVGLRATSTCDTLATRGSLVKAQRGIPVPAPVFSCAIIVGNRHEEQLLMERLRILQLEDPSISVAKNEQTEQVLLGGMGELHLDIARHRLLDDWRVRCRFGDIQIAFQETVVAHLARDHVHEQETSTAVMQAKLRLELSRLGEGEEFVPEGVAVEIDGELPLDVRAAIAEAIRGVRGPIGSFPLRAISVCVSGVSFPPAQLPATNVLAAQAAVRAAMLRLMREGKEHFRLAQPIMSLRITSPPEHVGSITADLHGARHGTILAMNQGLDSIELEAEAPLADLLGYASRVRSISSGTASFHMTTRGYQLVAPGKKINDDEIDAFAAEKTPVVTGREHY